MDTLFARLLTRFLFISLIVILAMGFYTMYFFSNFYFDRWEQQISESTSILTAYLSQALEWGDDSAVQRWLEITAELHNGQAWIVDHEGILRYSYPSLAQEGYHLHFAGQKEVLAGETIAQRVEAPYFERPMLLVGQPIYGNATQILLVFSPVAGINSTIRHVRYIMIYASVFTLLLAMLASFLWSRSLSSPLQRISHMALELAHGGFGQTIETRGRIREIDMVAGSINQLSQSLKETVEDLVKERDKLDHILKGMEEGVLAVDGENRVVLLNKTCLGLLGKEGREDKYLDRPLEEVVTNKDVRSMFLQVKEENKPLSGEIFLSHGRDQYRVLLRINSIYIQKERFWATVGLFQDISERWRFEQLQKDFVANVSHEMKTPLSSIRGSAELLLDGVVENRENQKQYLEMIINEAQGLTDLVDDTLELSAHEGRQEERHQEILEVQPFLQNIAFLFQKSRRAQNLHLHVPEKSLYFKGNSLNMKQVIVNLLDNAYKFSPEDSSIELGAAEEGDWISFWVQDQGPGVPWEEKENVWERFYKRDRARTPKSGSGLGLAIVKKIVEQHGGTVFLRDRPGGGAIFGFYLPKK